MQKHQKRTMAKFLVWSDLHNEFWRGFDLPDIDGIDGVLIGGDTSTDCRHLDIPLFAWDKYQVPVAVIWGNHELYGSTKESVEEGEKEILKDHDDADIRILKGDSTVICGTRIAGATLWTDLLLYPELFMVSKASLPFYINDYRMAYDDGRLLSVEKTLDWHRKDKKRLFDILSTPFDGNTIAMTHHLPIKQLIHPKHLGTSERDKVINTAFASDLLEEIKRLDVKAWICGHSHENVGYKTQGDFGIVEFIMNQRGYPHENLNFNPEYILEI